MEFFGRAAKETLLSALAATLVSCFALSLLAVFVRAYAPSQITITVCDKLFLCISAFLGALLFVGRERALFKGAAAGLCFLLFTTLLFGAIGGFRFSLLYLPNLLLAPLCGGLGGLAGAKLRKE